MDKSIKRGRVRNRYAKLHPLVNRINGPQDLNLASNYHQAERCDDEFELFDSYSLQLQNNFENLVLAKNMDTELINKPMDPVPKNSKMPATCFDQSVFSSTTNGDTARKQKKHKHRNKEKFNRTSLLGFRTELLDILNCILYIMWSPIVFFARPFLSLASLSASALYHVLKWSVPCSKNLTQKEHALQLTAQKPQISNNLPLNSPEEQQSLDLTKVLTKRSNDFNLADSCSVSQGAKNDVRIGQVHTEVEKSEKESQFLDKKYTNAVNKTLGISEFEGGNYFQYSSRHEDISSIELSSDCLSDKYNSSRFLDYKECRKRVSRQYQESLSVAGKKLSYSALTNYSFKGSRSVVNSKRLQINSKNSSRKSKLRLLNENLDARLSDASESSEKQLQKIDSKNVTCTTNRSTDLKLGSVDRESPVLRAKNKFNGHQKSSAILLNNFRKKRPEQFKPHAFPPLPLRLTLQKKSSTKDQEKCTERVAKCNSTLSNDLERNLTAPDLQNSNLQSIIERISEITKKSESHFNNKKDLSQKNELNNTAIVPTASDQHNAQKLILEHDGTFSSLQCRSFMGMLKNETIVSERSKDIFKSDIAAQRDESKNQTATSNLQSVERAEKDLLQCEKTRGNFEKEKRTNGLKDRPKGNKNEKSKTAEFTNPIDAKSKWIEMKKKFYGKDYVAIKEQPEKLEVQNLSQIKSVSKLPAHKIFQYNMLVGRARQMGEERPSVQDIFLEKKTTAPCLKVIKTDVGCDPGRNDQQFFKFVTPTPRCLSHTQSLSQWPLVPGNSFRTKKYSSLEKKPKPKPRTGAEFNLDRSAGDGKILAMRRRTAEFPQKPSNHANSPVSSSDVRDDQILQNGLSPLDWPSQVKNTVAKTVDLSNEYAEKIDSLISFCRHPFPAQREGIHRNFKQTEETS